LNESGGGHPILNRQWRHDMIGKQFKITAQDNKINFLFVCIFFSPLTEKKKLFSMERGNMETANLSKSVI
jgi:hypothetical protein